jgi:hypothetical protein
MISVVSTQVLVQFFLHLLCCHSKRRVAIITIEGFTDVTRTGRGISSTISKKFSTSITFTSKSRQVTRQMTCSTQDMILMAFGGISAKHTYCFNVDPTPNRNHFRFRSFFEAMSLFQITSAS